jgi:hypothetical protein
MLFRSAIALNNSGVFLLQHQCIKESVETFTDALRIAKMIAASKTDSIIQQKNTESTHEILLKSWKRTSSALSKSNDQLNYFPILTLSSDDSIRSIMLNIKQELCKYGYFSNNLFVTQTPFVCFTIPEGSDDDLGNILNVKVEIDFAFIMYNCAVANRVMAEATFLYEAQTNQELSSSCSISHATMLLSASIRFLQAADLMIRHLSCNVVGWQQTGGEYIDDKILLVDALVASALKSNHQKHVSILNKQELEDTLENSSCQQQNNFLDLIARLRAIESTLPFFMQKIVNSAGSA